MSRNKPDCVLQAVKIKCFLRGLLGEITIIQTYQNTESANIEAVFTFPVPVKAVLLGVEIQINDRQLQGQVLPKRHAEESYENAVSGGDSAILVQEAGRGLYTVNIGNLLSGETARLTYRYALLHVWNGDTLRFQLPTTVAPRYGHPLAAGLQPHQIPPVALDADNRFSLELELSGSLQQAAVESPSHPIRVAAGPEGLRVALASDQAFMDRDFILNIRASTEARAAFGLYAPDRDGWIALASFQPDWAEPADQGGRHCVLIADCSGSMAGDAIAQTRAALLAILDRLQPADCFNLIAFGSQPQAFFQGLQPANAANLARARAWATELDANRGGTEIGAALQLAYRQRPHKQPLDILLITDGEVWNVEELTDQAQHSGCRLFTVGVGAAVAEGLVRRLAETTDGACEFVHPNEGMVRSIVRHFERMRAPRAEASAHWPVEPSRRLPNKIRQVFSGDTLHLAAWLPTPPEGPTTLELTLSNGQRWSQRMTLERWPVAATADTLPRMAASWRIPGLAAEAATALAVEYQLVTTHTHFLMVDVRAEGEKPQDLPELRTVSHLLAAGWGGIGSVAGQAPPLAVSQAPLAKRKILGDGLSGRMAMRFSSGADLEYLDIPAFLRRQAGSDDELSEAPRRPAISEYQRSFSLEVVKEAPPAVLTATHLAWWMEIQAAQLADRRQPLPTLEELADIGLPDDLLTRLRELIAHGETEQAIVAALLHAFLQHGPKCSLPRNASRNIRSHFQRQVSAALAATVEPLVKAWCAAG